VIDESRTSSLRRSGAAPRLVVVVGSTCSSERVGRVPAVVVGVAGRFGEALPPVAIIVGVVFAIITSLPPQKQGNHNKHDEATPMTTAMTRR
jgi:hypothetical protein